MADFTINSQVNLNLPATVPEGFTTPEIRSAVEMFINAQQNMLRALEAYLGITQKDMTLWSSLTPSDTLLAHQLNRLYITAGEALSYGNFINLYNDAGTLKARKANATSGIARRAHGFCSTVGGTSVGSRGEVILKSGILSIAGVSPGQELYLSTTAGLATGSPATGAGQTEQHLGVGVATDLAMINISGGQFIQH